MTTLLPTCSHQSNTWRTSLGDALRATALILAGGLVAVLAGCGKPASSDATTAGDATTKGATQPLTKVQLQLNWFPEAEHGGYYTALVNGYYKDAGLDVELLKGGAASPVEQMVGSDRVQFGIVTADRVLVGRAHGVPLVALMAPFQINPRCVIVKDGAPYTGFDDLKNTTLVANQTLPYVPFLQKKFGLDGVSIVPYKGGMATFMTNDNYAIQGYVTSEPLTLEKKGVKTRNFLVADTGFNPYTSVLVASEAMVQAHPDQVRAMVQASARGWAAYLADPTSGNAAIAVQNPEIGLDVLNYGARKQHELMLVGDAADVANFGTMTAARWNELDAQLREIGLLKDDEKPVPGAFDTRFLPTAKPTAAPAATAPDAPAEPAAPAMK